MMEYVNQQDVATRLFDIGNNTPPSRLMFPLRDLANVALSTGYPREQLIEDFESLRAQFDEQGEEEREDAVLEAMDFLYGWCSPHMKI